MYNHQLIIFNSNARVIFGFSDGYIFLSLFLIWRGVFLLRRVSLGCAHGLHGAFGDDGAMVDALLRPARTEQRALHRMRDRMTGLNETAAFSFSFIHEFEGFDCMTSFYIYFTFLFSLSIIVAVLFFIYYFLIQI